MGRRRELERVGAGLTRPDAAGVLVAGPAGVGKSRLVVESAIVAERAGFSVIRILATRAASGIPLGALAPYLPAGLGSPTLRGDTLRTVGEAIVSGIDRRLLVVDDAHLLDDASATVVQHLAALNRASVVLTTRSGVVPPEPLVSLWKDSIIERVDLEPLTRPEVDRLLDAVLAGPIDGACCRDLWEASRGNVLFLRELVLGAREAGVLRCEGGLWCLTRELSTTPRLCELVGARLADLEPGEREVLELLALGEPLELEMIAQVSDLAVVDRLEGRGLGEVADTGRRRVRLGHPLHGEVLREQQMTTVRRMATSRRLADAAEAHGLEHPDDLLRAVIWRLDGGGRVESALLLSAARRAYFAHDLRLAQRLAGAAFETGAGVAAGLLLAQVLGGLGRDGQRYDLLCRLEGQTTTDEELALVVLCRADPSIMRLGRLAEADDDLARAACRLPPGCWRDELIAQRANIALMRGRLAEAITLTKPILDTPGHSRAVAKAALAAASCYALMGRCALAVVIVEQGLAVEHQLGEQEAFLNPAFYTVVHAIALGAAGQLGAAEDIVAAGYSLALASHNQYGQAWCASERGKIALCTGQLGTAAGFFAEATAILAQLSVLEYRRWPLAGQAMAAAQQGDLATTAAVIAELDTMPPDPMSLFEPDVLRAQAWHAWVRGDLGSAWALLRDAVQGAAVRTLYPLEAAGWHDLVRLGAAAEAVAPLARLAGMVEGDLVQAMASHAAGVAGNDAGLLVATADRFESLGALLLAAEAAAAASAVYRRHQQGRLADGLTTRTHALITRCQSAATPALRLAGPAAALTPREWEVATLAAQGLSSKAIAERFTVSVCTVDTHLQRIYVKLGITGRTELGTALSPPYRPLTSAH